jgi:hypothetical protein
MAVCIHSVSGIIGTNIFLPQKLPLVLRSYKEQLQELANLLQPSLPLQNYFLVALVGDRDCVLYSQ